MKKVISLILSVLIVGIIGGYFALSQKTIAASPPAITSFLATAVSSSQLDLSWTASGTNVYHYVVYSYEIGNYIYQGSDTSFSHTGLTEGSTYTYSIQAYNGEWSDYEYVSGTPSSPPAVISFSATASSSSQIDLLWTASGTGISSYALYNYEIGNYIYQGSDTSFSHTGLAEGLTYTYSIMAYNGSWSDPEYTSETTIASPPAITSFLATAVSSSQLDLSWTASGTNVYHYVVYSYEIGNYIYQGSDTSFSHTGLTEGSTYTYSIQAYNGEWSDYEYANAITNTSPVMTLVTIISNNISDNSIAYTDSTLTAIPDSTDADGDDVTYTYQWHKDGTDIIGETSLTLDSSNFVKNDIITVTVTPNDGTDDGVPMTSATGLTISNSTPTQPTVIVTNPAYESSDIICTVSGSTDADSDPITYSYIWEKDGANQSGQTTNTISLIDTLVLETWKCIVTPNDGTKNGTSGEDSVTVQADPNNSPIMTSVTITPDPAYTNSTLTATPDSTDADGDDVTYTYQWHKDGTDISGETSPTLASNKFDKNDAITVTVTPNDGTDDGVPMTSAGLTISNTSPTQPTVTITDPAYDSDDLICSASGSTDADGDVVTYSYLWTNGTATVSEETLSASNTAISEIWTCEATPNDGIENGTEGSVSITIQADLDSVSPASILDLTVPSSTEDSITLEWTASGDDENTGTATSYDIRHSTSNITNETEWNNATQVDNEPFPSLAGTVENFEITGLNSGTTYYFAIKTSDEVPNESEMSNIASGETLTPVIPLSSDTTAPAAITDLGISNISNHTLKLNWTAPGDDDNIGTAASYDIRFSINFIDDSSDQLEKDNWWAGATQISSPSAPSPKETGTSQSVEVNNLNSGTTYYFAMKSSDEVPNESEISNIADATTNAPSSGGGGGSYNPPKDKTPPGKAKGLNIKNRTEKEKGVEVSWENPNDSDFSKVVIIRKEKGYPKNVNDGAKVYENNGNKFEDGGAEEGKVYYYSIYSYDKSGNYSEPINSIFITNKSLIRKDGDSKVYVVNNNKKQWITTSKVFNKNGYKWENIYDLASKDIDGLENGEDIKGSGVYKLIRSKNGHKVYVVKGNKRLWIPTAEAFNKKGYKWKDVVEIDDGEMSAYADIKLIKEAGSPKVYQIYSGISIKHWIPTAEIFLSYLNKWEDIETVDKAELDGYSDVKLIKKIGGYKVYYLENGAKRHIVSPSVFASNGFNWNNVAEVSEMEFNFYHYGENFK